MLNFVQKEKNYGDFIFYLSRCFRHLVGKMPEPLISSKKQSFWSNFLFTVIERGQMFQTAKSCSWSLLKV